MIEITVTVKTSNSSDETTLARTASYGDHVNPSSFGQKVRDAARQLGDELGDCLDVLTA